MVAKQVQEDHGLAATIRQLGFEVDKEPLGDEAAELFAGTLTSKMPSLKKLWLSGNRMTDEGKTCHISYCGDLRTDCISLHSLRQNTYAHFVAEGLAASP